MRGPHGSEPTRSASRSIGGQQTAAKATFVAIIRSNIAALRETDYRIRDTGDGALIAFVTDPEHALYMALAIAQDFGRAAAVAGFPSNSLRTGLHLGAVKEVIDVEARPNYIGDGINAAKRIMDFAAPGQITASRAFFDAVAGLDAAFGALFRHVGAPDDKHARAHELYTVEPSDTVLERLKQELAAAARDSAAAAGKSPAPIKVRLWSAPAIAADGQVRSSRAGEIARRGLFVVIAVIALGAVSLFAFNKRTRPAIRRILRRRSSLPTPPTPKQAAAPPAPEKTVESQALDHDRAQVRANAPGSRRRRAASAPAPHSTQPEAAPPAMAAKTTPKAKPKTEPSPPAPAPANTASDRSSPRCSRIMEKATLGETLTTEEKKELASSCR
jgi:class 3 adenylate cyclase